MTLHPKTELLIQRCVDDELSAADTRALLQQLDSINGGWKFLACGLLEDRHLRRTLGPETPCPPSIPDVPAPPVRLAQPSVSTTRLRHWWNHPITSLSLCAAIAFVGGMLVSDGRSPSPAAISYRNNTAVLPPGTSGFTVQLPGDPERRPVPVYEDFRELRRTAENHPFLQRNDEQQSMRVLVLPAADGRTIVVPLENSRQHSLQ